MTTAGYLESSWAAHRAAVTCQRAKDRTGAQLQRQAAYTLRVAALASDPDRADPAWARESAYTNSATNTHEALMTFYVLAGCT
jgi:hypothetical protein